MLVARTRRLDLAEDALSEAFARAASQWPTTGEPNNPAGWLYTTANRLVIGNLRAEAMRGRKNHLLAVDPHWVQETDVDHLGDERLTLLLLCCHPALHPHSRSPLALRLVLGTSTADIARLFLVPQPTMAARITRAKKKIAAAGIPLNRPVAEELDARLDDVCQTIYLAFTAGYTPGTGPDLLRAELAGEAVELAAILGQLVPDAAQVQALHGLLVLQHARRDARVNNGTLVTLGDQDRSRWHRRELTVGAEIVRTVEPTDGYAEELRLQGLIAAEHAVATTADHTNWTAIARLYESLETLTGSPIVRLNRAVAVAEVDGPTSGLELLVGLDDALSNNHRFHAVRADFATRAGDLAMAESAYHRALELCANEVESEHLTRRLEALAASRR